MVQYTTSSEDNDCGVQETARNASSHDPPPPYFVSKDEAMFYYSGISPSPPKLVYHTGLSTTPWVKPKGLEAYRKLKEVRGIFGHKLNDVWEDVGPQVRDLLNVRQISWTSIDVARFITDGGSDTKVVGSVTLWIGVRPDSFKGAQALSSWAEILELIKVFGIEDVDVEFRESLYRRSAGPPLLRHVSKVNHTADVRGPLTPTLCLSIAASDRPDAKGTMGLYDKVLGLTCHHVLFKTDATTNDSYVLANNASAPRKYVQLLGTCAFDKLLDSIKLRIGRHAIMLKQHEEGIERLEKRLAGGVDGDDDDEDEVAEAEKELELTKAQLKPVNDAIETLEKFYAEAKKDWGAPRQRTIGHIRSSPAVAFNVSPEARRTTFKYPSDRLLPLRGMISRELMHRPDMLDHDNEPCLIVIKNGNATGVTIGRATGLFSFESKEWAIYNYDKNSGVFSAPGDSGSIVVDGLGRIGGLLTGGAGKTETSDVTYVAPMFWLWPRVKTHFPDASLSPTTIT
ncbi:hypothetical protein NEOLEDRAFT_1158983 [Neolentinus lepideus HHB14362 ss-1]|uniref:Uncharacterized protein n=1 Tax=Neolentinus lepideus HHB14362 ss-1 TaxID=1314782 RepID=A0A165NHR6_9AGAM|nr:hypothetical protein NEOLEDRAFT_1158983 [Neolentinus lepideus HHB14362 ss-1]